MCQSFTGESKWLGPHQQHKICVSVLKSQCISQIVNFLLINKEVTKKPDNRAFYFLKYIDNKDK
jgi:hypothetical protein